MFKPAARWWSERNKIRVDFKLRFHASQVGTDGLVVSLVPAESSKPTVKSERAVVRDGSCVWENPVYETVKFTRDPKTGKIHHRMYYIVVGTESSESGVFGEASINFADYAEATKVSLVSLPLKNSKTEAMLHISIQRINDEADESENVKSESVDQTLSSRIENRDHNGTRGATDDMMPFVKTFAPTELNSNHRTSSESDVTLSSSETSSGVEAPWELRMITDNMHQDPKSGETTPTFKEDHRRSWDWLGNSGKFDSLNAPMKDTLPWHEDSEEAPYILIEKLKSEVVALSRQAGVSELELQTLRKQLVKESKIRQNLWTEIGSLKEGRNASKGDCYRQSKTMTNLDSQAVIEELKQELNHVKELNANLEIQLQKTQESNSELILAVQDLDEMLEQHNRSCNEEPLQAGPKHQPGDDEQKALEELMKEHSDDRKEEYLLDQQLMDMRSEIEFYKREKEELEMQMEQLALDYEIMAQSNHELSNKLQQSQIQEQLKMQYECSSSDSGVNGLETHIENLEDELKRQSNEYIDSLDRIRALEDHTKGLEEELEKQASGFEAAQEALLVVKVEQEQRAIKAEDTLKKIRWKNANTAERLQEEFRRLSMQMSSTFEANERLTTKAMAEANELRFQKSRLEDMLRVASEEKELVEAQMEKKQSDIEEKEGQLENLRDEIETHVAKNKILLEELKSKKALMNEMEQMRISVKEKELLVEQVSDERIELERKVVLMKNEAEKSLEELNKMRCLVKEQESIIANKQSELDSVQAECRKLEKSGVEGEMEKERLRKQVLQLRSDLKKREEALSLLENKIKDGSGRGAATLDVVKTTSKTTKSSPRASRELTSLKERIKLLESQIKSKQTDHETSVITFLEKEKDMCNKIEELEGRLEVYKSNEKPAAAVEAVGQATIRRLSEMAGNGDNNSNDLSEEVKHKQIELLEEKHKSMEEELQEMQERYLDISLKFAEVESERQQLIMKLRNLTNANKSS